jgi:hypothetical protein
MKSNRTFKEVRKPVMKGKPAEKEKSVAVVQIRHFEDRRFGSFGLSYIVTCCGKHLPVETQEIARFYESGNCPQCLAVVGYVERTPQPLKARR